MKKVFSTFSDYFKEVIYGGIDGIVTTFAVVSGGAGAALSNDQTSQLVFVAILLFGLANLFADAASMGLGNFLSVRSEKDLYSAIRAKEEHKLQNGDAGMQLQKTVAVLQERGFSPEDAAVLARLYQNNQDYWLDFIMRNEQDMADPRSENEFFTGLATFLSFMIFGAVPLLPFMFQESGDPTIAFTFSVVGTVCALVLLGILKWRVIGSAFLASLFEVVAVGGTAAVLAYLVGTFFAL